MSNPDGTADDAARSYWVPVRDECGVIDVRQVFATCPSEALERADWPAPERRTDEVRER